MNFFTGFWTLVLTSLIFCTPTSFAQSDLLIDDLGIIDLKSGASSLKFRYNYPGMNGPDGFNAPDCLMFVSSGVDFELPDGALQQLAANIKLTDGPGHLIPVSEINILTPVLTDRTLVYYFRDLSKFVTGLEISTQNGSSLKAALEQIFGADFPHFIGLQVVRSCRLLQ
jgi:hypothetical protein